MLSLLSSHANVRPYTPMAKPNFSGLSQTDSPMSKRSSTNRPTADTSASTNKTVTFAISGRCQPRIALSGAESVVTVLQYDRCCMPSASAHAPPVASPQTPGSTRGLSP